MVALWNAPHCIFGAILTQANRTWAVIGLRQSPTLSEHNLRIGFDIGLVEAHYNHSRLAEVDTGNVSLVVGTVAISLVASVVVSVISSNSAAVGFDSDAGVGCEHDGGDEDEYADGDRDAVTESDAGGGDWRSRRGHERGRGRIRMKRVGRKSLWCEGEVS